MKKNLGQYFTISESLQNFVFERARYTTIFIMRICQRYSLGRLTDSLECLHFCDLFVF